jgi:hypothetical protein
MARLFISADQMDRWTAEGKVSLSDDVMTLPALGRSFQLRTAVRFKGVSDATADTHGLVGRVKTDTQLAELGCEQYGSSVILGEVGYECEEGFIGLPVDGSHSGLLKIGT